MSRSLTAHWTFRVALTIAFCFLLGFSYNYHLPKLEAFLLIEVEKITQRHSPIGVWANKLNFHLFPIGVVLEDVTIKAKAPLDKILPPAKIRRVGARLAILPLLRGEFRLSQLYLQDSELSLFLRNELFEKSGNEPPKIDFDLLYSLPIDELSLEHVTIQGRFEPRDVVFRGENLNVTLENRFRSLYLDFDAPVLKVKPSGPMVPLLVQAEVRTLIEASEMQISALKLKADDGFLVASGRFNGDFTKAMVENGALDARVKMAFPDLNKWERVFFARPQLPVLKGRGEIDLGVEFRQQKPFKIETEVKTEDLAIDKYVVGDIRGKANSDMKTIRSDLIQFKNSSGAAKIKNAVVTLEPKLSFAAGVQTEKIHVDRFLNNLGLKNIPVDLAVDGEANCQGEWDKKEVFCKAKVSSPRFHVHTGKPANTTIVEALDLRADGEVKVTTKDVSYQGDLFVGKSSHAKSTGRINYETGFKIDYDADKVAFADVKNLANLKFEGNLVLKGSTEGTSSWATIDMKLNGSDLWLEDYPFGALSSTMRYKAGHLYFTDAEGQYEVSRYRGNMEINLLDSRLKMALDLPFVEIKDLQSMFQRKVKLPVEGQGTGTGVVEAEGPFSFRDLSYHLKSNFYRGSLAGESFDQLTFNVRSVDGLVQSENIHMQKASGSVTMKGQINRDGIIDSVVVARSLRLEQSENVLALGFDVQGLADVTLLLRGQLPRPHMELNGRFSRVVLADQAAEDSIFKLSFHPDRLEGSGQFLGSKVFGDFIIPYDDQAPFLFRMKAKKWDFTSLFSMVSRTAKQLDFETSVSASINLRSAKGGFWTSSGQIQVDEFVVRKGASLMNAEKPMYISAREGVFNSSNFALTSGESYMKLDIANLSRNSLNASLNGKMDLALLGLFTPFITDLRGNLALSVDLRGTIEAAKLSGSAYLDRGYAKFADFTHPFSNVRADILFNDNQILLNSVRGDMASGTVAGQGRLTFANGSRTVDVKGDFNDVKINVPENFRSTGSGTVAIRGSGFPYTMDINYGVTGGEVTYEIGENTTGGATYVKASNYLPKFLNQEVFHPFTFLIDVNIKNPVLVNNSQMQAQVAGQVKATGTPDRLSLTGTISPLPGGKVFARDTPFDIQSAFVEYNGNPPWAPRIFLTATTRVSESVQEEQRTSEHQYDVNLLVQGRGPNPQIVLTSQPPLSQREIVSLLALGLTTSAMDERKSSDFQAANTSTAIGTAILQRAGGRKLKDSLGVELKVSSSQPTPDTASTPKVTLSKQWTPKFGASASSTLQTNPTNNVKVEYKMNKNVSAVGSWEGRESVQDKKDTTQNVFGLDLEYKVQFK